MPRGLLNSSVQIKPNYPTKINTKSPVLTSYHPRLSYHESEDSLLNISLFRCKIALVQKKYVVKVNGKIIAKS